MTIPAVPFWLSAAISEMGEGFPNWVSTVSPLVGGPPFWCSSLAGRSNTPSISCVNAIGDRSSAAGAGTLQTSTTATASGGAGGYSYSFAYVSGTNFTNSVSGASITFSLNYVKNQNIDESAVWQATVTDANGHAASIQFSVQMTVAGNQ